MTIDEVIQLIDVHLTTPLTEVQIFVLQSCWEGKSYTQMALDEHYGAEYLRKTGAMLWSILSDIWGEPIQKATFRSLLEPRPLTRKQQQLLASVGLAEQERSSFEFPNAPLPLNSLFYIERPPVETLAYQEILQPGSVLRIKAPWKMGKSSLILRILDRATNLGYHKVEVDFQQADAAVFASLDKLLRWFCALITRTLKLTSKLEEYWDEEIGSKVSCTIYFQAYIIPQIKAPLVLVLNEVNRLFEYPEVALDFLPMLRFWHEQAKKVQAWQKLRLVVAYSTEIYIPLNLNQSPFNVGQPLKLPPLNLDQVQELAQRYKLAWFTSQEAQQLLDVVGGHPYLVQLAFYHLAEGNLSFEKLLQQAPTEGGIYNDHLRRYFNILQAEPELLAAFQEAIASEESGVTVEPIIAYKLDSMGLVNMVGDRITPSCQLYAQYFHAPAVCNAPISLAQRLQQLERENESLTRLYYRDELTQLANRRYFEEHLQQQWSRLQQQEMPLSLILCDLDCFRLYNKNFGKIAGNFCLQQVASAILEVVPHFAALVARYGGEEFAVLLPATDGETAMEIAEKIRVAVKNLAIAHDIDRLSGFPAPVITVSLGVGSTIPQAEHNLILLLNAAETALYESKHYGRDRATLHRC